MSIHKIGNGIAQRVVVVGRSPREIAEGDAGLRTLTGDANLKNAAGESPLWLIGPPFALIPDHTILSPDGSTVLSPDGSFVLSVT